MALDPTLDPTMLADSADAAETHEAVETVEMDPSEVMASEPERPERLGRYLVLDTLGRGGMGVVYLAYDPGLDRRVAIKLLRGHAATSAARERLLREAQAMAQLSHPNVVPVFDVGTVDEQVFVAMDYVVGETVGAWLGAESRDWRAILAVFSAAGRGLAHAHAHGIVHRDFKPDNAMVSVVDGQTRVQVLDFGLAKAVGADVTPDEGPSGTAGDGSDPFDPRTLEVTEHSALTADLTQAGSVLGTPGYMSPEQFRGQPADARSDQYSFCVALYEGLYGRRPIRAKTYRALSFAVVTKAPEPPPSDSRVPARLWPILARGLAKDPSERWPDMATLLDALADDPSQRRKSRVLAALIFAGFAAAIAWGATRDRGAAANAPPPKCASAGDGVDRVVGDDARRAIANAYAGTDDAGLGPIAAEVDRQLDTWAGTWASLRTDACEATEVAGEQSAELMDLRMACYDRALADVGATVELLRAGEAAVLAKGVDLVSALPGLEHCANAKLLRAAHAPPDPAIATDVEAVRAELARVRSLRRAGRPEDALALVETLHGRAEALTYPPLIAETSHQLGRQLAANGKHEDGQRALEQAFYAALRVGDDHLAQNAIEQLVFEVGYHDADYEAGMRWAAIGSALIARDGSEGSRNQADLAEQVATVELQAGNLDQAREQGRRALAIRAELVGPEHTSLTNAHNVVGAADLRGGRYAEAAASFEQALAIATRAYGPEHPEVAFPLNNLALAYERQAKFDESAEALTRVLAILEGSFGPEHPNVGLTKMNLGGILLLADQIDEATPHLEAAVTLLEAALGEDHQVVARALTMRGDGERLRGELEIARASYARSLAIREAELGADHVDNSLSLLGLGRTELLLGNPDEAARHLQRAVELLDDEHSDPIDRGLARFELAKALSRAGDDARVGALLDAARADFEAGGVRAEADLATLEAWAETH